MRLPRSTCGSPQFGGWRTRLPTAVSSVPNWQPLSAASKGVRRSGVRLGNWLRPEQGRRLLDRATPSTPRELRDHTLVAMLIACGLRRAELLALSLESIQQREQHWVCRSRRHRQVGPTRPAAHLRPPLLPRGRRTGSDPISARPPFHPDDRALPWMQAEAPGGCERPIGNRTCCRLTVNTPGRMRCALSDYP